LRTIVRLMRGILLSAVLLPGSAWALGFGDIRLKSALNAPLDAEIELSATADELGSVRAGLASREQFARSGMDYPVFLNSATVRVGKTADGRNVLEVRTVDPVTEPFLTMLVQVSYARGQLIREYTVLLDPPVFANQSASPAVSAPSAGVQARTGEVTRAPAAPVPPPAPPPAATPSSGSYRVRAGDTLSAIAGTRYPRVDRESALLGIYRANPQAFDGNMNVLKRDALLNLPAESDLARIGPSEAHAEVSRQFRSWADQRGGARLRLVPPAETAPTPAGRDQSAGLQQRVTELEQQLAEKDRLLTLRSAELARLQQRGNAVPPGPTAVSPAQPAATAPSVPAAVPPASVPSEPPVAVAPMAPSAQKPLPKAAPAPEAESSLLDSIMRYWYLPVAGIALLASVALFLRGRRASDDAYGDRRFEQFGASAGAPGEAGQTLPVRQLPDAVESIVVEETGSHRPDGVGSDLSTPSISLSEEGAGTSSTTISSAALDQGDPLAEADFHMAYGLYDQAADLVNQAIAREPQRRELKLKLLEVYFVWGNREKFEQLAADLAQSRDGGAPGEWEKIVIMGRQIAADNPLFTTTSSSTTAAADGVDLNLEGGQNHVDFDLMGEPSTGSGDTHGFDLDLGGTLSELPGTETGSRGQEDSGVDFLLDTPVRGEGGELYTQMISPDAALKAIREGALPDGGAAAEMPDLDIPEQGTVRINLEGRGGMPEDFGFTAEKENTAELALDDLGLDVGAMETPPAGGSHRPDEDILLEGHTGVLPDLESGPEGNWLLQGTEDSSEHMALPEFPVQPEPSTQPSEPHEDHAATGGLLATEIDAALSGLPIAESGSAPADLASSSAITAVMPVPDLQGPSTMATGRFPAPSVTPAALPEMDMPTMSEVGTKLDLARAYMDMGDPEGARSILDEVLAEGSVSQKQEARRLIESLPG